MAQSSTVSGAQTKQSPPNRSSEANSAQDAENAERNLENETNSNGREKQVEHDLPHGFQLAMIILSLVLTMFLVALDMSIIATAIPKITRDFHSLSQVGWYGSAFFLTLASFVALWGKVYKYFPIKWAFLTSIAIFELGSLICGVSPNSTTLIVGRAVQGIGGAGMTNGAFGITAFIVPRPRVAAYMGLFGGIFGIASVIGPFLGGVFTQKISWRWCFYINLPVGGLAMFSLLLFYHTPTHIKPTPATNKERLLMMDVPGILVLVASLVCFLLALEWGGVSKTWDSPDVIGTLVGWISLLGLWIFIQWKQGERAMLVPRMLNRRVMKVCGAFIFCTNCAQFARTYNLPIYFQAIDGVSPLQSGIRILPTAIALSLSVFISSAMVGKVGYFQPFLIAGSMLAIIGGGLIYIFDVDTPVANFIGYQVVAALGVGMALQIPIIVAQSTSRLEDISAAMSAILLLHLAGGAFGVSAGQSILNNRLVASLPKLAPNVSVEHVLRVGAYNLPEVFDGEDLAGILQSYLIGLKAAWIFSIAFAGVTFILSLFAGWTSIKPQRKDTKDAKSTASAV